MNGQKKKNVGQKIMGALFSFTLNDYFSQFRSVLSTEI